MSDNPTPEKVAVIKQCQRVAEEKIGTPRNTEVILWDDGDFKVQVTHGLPKSFQREKVVWRSSESCIYPAETFVYVRERVVESEATKKLERQTLDSATDRTL